MYKHCTTEESVRRQRQLEQCLLELMQTIPYPQITVSHVCDLAGLSRKSFYRYFTNKDGCLYSLIDHCIYDGSYHYLPSTFETVDSRMFYTRFFTYWYQNRQLIEVLTRNSLSILLPERMVHYVQAEERGFPQYLGKRTDSAEQLLFMISGIMGLVLNWHHTGYQKTPEQMAQIMEHISQN